jgi:hypothetical protein
VAVPQKSIAWKVQICWHALELALVQALLVQASELLARQIQSQLLAPVS